MAKIEERLIWKGEYADVILHDSWYCVYTKDRARLAARRDERSAIEAAKQHDKTMTALDGDKRVYDKWEEVLDYATQHATGKGMHTGSRWLEDSFNEYLAMSDEVPGFSMGGQPGSQFNREVLAGKILLELGDHFGSRHLLNENQEAKLKKTLDEIVNEPSQHRGLGR